MTNPVISGIEAAQAYDRWYRTRWGRYAFSIEMAAVRQACGPLAGRAVLDVGCGTGRFTAGLADDGATVTGLDRDPAMLAVAAAHGSGIALVQGDARDLPFQAGTFDVAVAVCVCEFSSDPFRVVSELARVVRPGGRVVIGALNPASPWGLRHRRGLKRPPWTDARFLTGRTLCDLGVGHGSVRLHPALYAPGIIAGIDHYGTLLETLGRGLAPRFAAFKVLACTKARSQS